MIDKKEFKLVRFFGFDFAQCSQFKEFNYEQEKTPIQARLYFLMCNGQLLRGQKESLYGWTGRIGLSKSTAFGIFSKGNLNMHLSVAQKIAEATGANVEWIQHGIGEPFPLDAETAQHAVTADHSDKTDVPLSIDQQLLTQAIETAEKALVIAKGTMTPDDKAEFIATLFLNDNLSNINEELLKACISLIEKALKETRRTLSPEPKSELIIVIYNFYYDKPWTEEHLKSALDQLIRSVS
ncbi:hypothetical protein [Acinetobacter pragensis]|uniref:Uncharacterized protein n=1 Tax=Acinetobacter pragensis TaxID=1806892 RepID=A0A151XXV5_9GAMM|nr:hypothetical protein [Acinetobacter pragensis]KYQ70652.1 hypothetical protein AZH43_17765 [Acinetobacter pragensis]